MPKKKSYTCVPFLSLCASLISPRLSWTINFFKELEVRRLPKTGNNRVAGTARPAGVGGRGGKSAEADHRRQAVIAAAEAREKKHKAKSKPIARVTKSTLEREQQLLSQKQQSMEFHGDNNATAEPLSEESRQAAAAAKQGEAAYAAQLGYNPYETARVTAGQARTATTATQHGNIDASGAGDHMPSKSSSSAAAGSGVAPIPAVAPPRAATTSVEKAGGGAAMVPIPLEMEEALTTLVSHPDVDVRCNCATILKKLIVNATTKGQKNDTEQDTEAAKKFRKVRLANAKIKSSVVDVPGAIDILMSVGFTLQEQDGESCLIYPAYTPGPAWLPTALDHLSKV